eukprot:5009168-Pyramimonas_sp.AAC.1
MGPRSAVLGVGDACGLRDWDLQWSSMRAALLGPSVDLPMGPRNAVMGGGSTCGLRQWDLRLTSLWGHETLQWAGEAHAGCA